MFRFVKQFHTSALRRIAVGDAVPTVPLHNGSPATAVNLAKETAKGKFVVVGVPGAFSPGCSQRHVPEYLKLASQFQNKGVDHLYVVTVNDGFVTGAWKDAVISTSGAPESAKFVDVLADASGEFSKKWDTLFDASKFFGNPRSKRFAAVVENGKVTQTFVEGDNTGIDASEAAKVLEKV